VTGGGQRHGHHTIFERAGRVQRVVLDPQVVQPDGCTQPWRRHQRREAGAEVDPAGVPGVGGPIKDRQQIGVAPQSRWTGLDALPGDHAAHGVVVVHDLERAETELAGMGGGHVDAAAAFSALQRLDIGHDASPPSSPDGAGPDVAPA
jgi:hypothetical protein